MTLHKCIIKVQQGDLTQGDSLVLVNASNTNGILGAGVSAAISRTCGKELQTTITNALTKKFVGPMQPGDILITDAGKHPKAQFVAHVAVMDYRQGFNVDPFPTVQTIKLCCQNLWQTLEQLQADKITVAMVALGASTGQLGVRFPTEIACETLKAHLNSNTQSKIGEVTFYGYQPHEYTIMLEIISKQPTLIPKVTENLLAASQKVTLAHH
ncbi:MAG: macro domain-containing protein [Deltaproteobacteria bacterium]|nr:macro domain-containing protein [Deltaproteobacteria bacterium]